MARNKNNITKDTLSNSPDISNNIRFQDPLLENPTPTDTLDIRNLSLGSNVISQQEDTLQIENIPSKIIDRSFGGEGDYIEVHINDELGNTINRIKDFINYEITENNTLSLDPDLILKNLGHTSGKFNVIVHLLRNKIFNTNEYPFNISEISSKRRELKSTSSLPNNLFISSVSQFITEIESSAYFKEFSLLFDNGTIVPAINIRLNKSLEKHELILKTLNPLSALISNSFKIVEEVIDPISLEIDLGFPIFEEESIELRGPNFEINTRQENSIPSSFKDYDSLLDYNFTSSYQYLLNNLENPETLNIQYDYIRPVSESSYEESYHFENFIHFSSAVERVKNFKYKLELIEEYDSKITTINKISGSTSGSTVVLNDKESFNTKKEKVIKNFDGYERFLYFTSGTFAWPKSNPLPPFTNYHTTSSQSKNWLGDEKDAYSLYGGQLLSASLYDRVNPHNLNKLIPEFIAENDNNSLYVSFVNMIGQHFDQVWTYIKQITEINNPHNSKGISKELVYFQLKNLGIETFDQFENSNLIEYILGEGSEDHTVGSLIIGTYTIGGNSHMFYNTPQYQTLVTSSNEGSTPKQDITKEIWKRLYHNAPYLLKTKGTERGIKALMSCYGVPTTILNVKEYGGNTVVSGPLKDLDTSDVYKTFSYEKSGLALKGDSSSSGYFVKTNWSSSLVNALSSSAKTVEFRIKPFRSNNKYHLFTLSGSIGGKDPSLILNPYTGSDVSSSDDSTQYGRLDLYLNGAITSSTSYFPIYNGDFWNVHIGTIGTSGSSANIDFGAYQANWLKNISYYTTSFPQTEVERGLTFGDPYSNGGADVGGAKFAYIGGIEANTSSLYNDIDILSYSGSIQEVKYHFGESLTHSTLKKHALEPFMYSGNTISSSYNTVILRLPLGSNDQQDSSSFHPNIDVPFLGMEAGISSSLVSQEWEEVLETHHLPTPDTVGASMTSEKVRIDEGTVDNNILDLYQRAETSTLDRQPPDFEDLGIFFSPTNEINEDILYTLGSFRMDDYIGSPLPSVQTSSNYENLKDLKDIYFKKIKRNRYNYGDYIKLIQYIDHTLFKLIEEFVPFRANTKTGLLIEPHYLERNKFAREIPTRTDGQTMVTGSHQTFEVTIDTSYSDNKIYNLSTGSKAFGIGKNVAQEYEPGTYVVHHSNGSAITSSRGLKTETGTNGTILIYEDHLNPFKRDKNSENNQSSQAPIKPFGGANLNTINGIGHYKIGSTFTVVGKGVDHSIIGSTFTIGNYGPGPDDLYGVLVGGKLSLKPHNYKAKKSNALLGNVVKGRKSSKYYMYGQFPIATSSLYTGATSI